MAAVHDRRCIFCHGVLPANDAVEHFPLGRRIAFDPGRGRLWAVCPACRRWNLAPIETRWEALEELERTHRDRGRLLASTDNIALIEAPGVELVRVGDARLAEEAWWRYGAEMLRRRSRAQLVTWAERGALVAMAVATGGLNFWLFGGNLANDLLRWHRFGSTAWRGESRCLRCGALLTEVSFKKSRYLYLVGNEVGSDAGPALRLTCRSCRLRGRDGEHRLEGLAAQHVLRRVVTRHHFRGASEKRVRSATDYIDRLGSPEAVTRELAGRGLRLDSLLDRHRRTEAVALEIALNDENERRLLELELAELEHRWREEEEIAAIVDGELTPVSGLDRLRRELRRGGRRGAGPASA